MVWGNEEDMLGVTNSLVAREALLDLILKLALNAMEDSGGQPPLRPDGASCSFPGLKVQSTDIKGDYSSGTVT